MLHACQRLAYAGGPRFIPCARLRLCSYTALVCSLLTSKKLLDIWLRPPLQTGVRDKPRLKLLFFPSTLIPWFVWNTCIRILAVKLVDITRGNYLKMYEMYQISGYFGMYVLQAYIQPHLTNQIILRIRPLTYIYPASCTGYPIYDRSGR